MEDRPSLSGASSDSEWGVSNINETAHTSTTPGHGWTLVKSKSQRLKSVPESSSNQNQRGFHSIYLSKGAITDSSANTLKKAKCRKHESKSNTRPTSSPDWPSLPGPSFVEDNSSLQGSHSSGTKRFSANHVELQELKFEQKAKEHLRRDPTFTSLRSADKTDYDFQQSHNSSRQLESTELDCFLSCKESPKQDSFPTDVEPLSGLNVTYTGLTEPRRPVRSSKPSLNSSPEKRTGDLGNKPRSQWESLEQISPLQIHHTLDLANKTKHDVLTTKVKSEPPLDTDVSSQVESNFNWAPPPGVSPLCVHFLQDNRKGQPFRHPKPCSNCTKHSKLLYGIWRSDTKEWQVMRPYPKAVNSNVPFQLCWHFSNRVKCQKSPCTFAHGNEELMFWTSERQSGRL